MIEFLPHLVRYYSYLWFCGIDIEAFDGVLGLLNSTTSDESLTDGNELVQKFGKRITCKKNCISFTTRKPHVRLKSQILRLFKNVLLRRTKICTFSLLFFLFQFFKSFEFVIAVIAWLNKKMGILNSYQKRLFLELVKKKII